MGPRERGLDRPGTCANSALCGVAPNVASFQRPCHLAATYDAQLDNQTFFSRFLCRSVAKTSKTAHTTPNKQQVLFKQSDPHHHRNGRNCQLFSIRPSYQPESNQTLHTTHEPISDEVNATSVPDSDPSIHSAGHTRPTKLNLPTLRRENVAHKQQSKLGCCRKPHNVVRLDIHSREYNTTPRESDKETSQAGFTLDALHVVSQCKSMDTASLHKSKSTASTWFQTIFGNF